MNSYIIETPKVGEILWEEYMEPMHISAYKLAKDSGCYNLTLNVWSCNSAALRFYQKMGLVPQKIVMETVL